MPPSTKPRTAVRVRIADQLDMVSDDLLMGNIKAIQRLDRQGRIGSFFRNFDHPSMGIYDLHRR